MVFSKHVMTNHTKPLYLRAHVNGKPLDKVLVDNSSTINVIPLRVLLSLGKTKDDIISTNLVVTTGTGDTARTLGAIQLQITVGSKTSVVPFFKINSTASDKLFLGKDWIHTNICVSSTLYQFRLFLNKDKVKMVRLGTNPSKIEVNVVDACFYYWDTQPINFEGLDQEGRPTILKFAMDKHIMLKVSYLFSQKQQIYCSLCQAVELSYHLKG